MNSEELVEIIKQAQDPVELIDIIENLMSIIGTLDDDIEQYKLDKGNMYYEASGKSEDFKFGFESALKIVQEKYLNP